MRFAFGERSSVKLYEDYRRYFREGETCSEARQDRTYRENVPFHLELFLSVLQLMVFYRCRRSE
jgi:hypothetical protein